jgi:predicted  nucleic acid-binding Zn-ribbon protein
LSTPNLKQQLEILRQLQEFDSQIYRLTDEKTAKPKEIEVLRAAFEEKKLKLAQLEKASLDAQKEKKDRELEFAAKEEAAKKLQSQLYQLKTNKEYNTMLQQIQDAKADASMIEDKILESMDKMDRVKAQAEEEKKRLDQEEQVFNAQKQKVDARIKEIQDVITGLEGQRAQLLPGIDKKILHDYERILKLRDGLAISCVTHNSTCSGCNMTLPPQVVNLTRMYDKIITCDVCNRILFVPDDGQS